MLSLAVISYRMIITSLESGAAWFGFVEEWFVEKQGALVRIFLVVEIFTVGLFKTFRRTHYPSHVLHGVRYVRAALAGIRVALLTYLRCHHDDNRQLD